MQQAKTQISLRRSAGWSAYSLAAWEIYGPCIIHTTKKQIQIRLCRLQKCVHWSYDTCHIFICHVSLDAFDRRNYRIYATHIRKVIRKPWEKNEAHTHCPAKPLINLLCTGVISLFDMSLPNLVCPMFSSLPSKKKCFQNNNNNNNNNNVVVVE